MRSNRPIDYQRRLGYGNGWSVQNTITDMIKASNGKKQVEKQLKRLQAEIKNN